MEQKRFTLVVYLLLRCCGSVYCGKFPVPADHVNRDWNRVAQDDLESSLHKSPIQGPAKNVILFLGDGMGLTTVWASRVYTGQQKLGSSGEEYELAFDQFPWTGLAKTYNVDFQIPDSAGTATAYLCGVKANVGTVGVSEHVSRGVCSGVHENSVTSIFDWSKQKGKSVGFVTTARVTHATPAAAYAHSPERDWEYDGMVPAGSGCADIALQLVRNNSDIDVVFGGGLANFRSSALGGKRTDTDLVEEWEQRQTELGRRHKVISNLSELRELKPAQMDSVLGLFADSHMAHEIDRDENIEPSLMEMTRTSIEILQSNNKGFFLMVEGARIDHGHHNGFAQKALRDTWAMDEAVAEAVRMTSELDTLIIVTADHSHAFATQGYPHRGTNIVGQLSKEELSFEAPLDGKPYLTMGYLNGPGAVINQVRRDITNDQTTDKDYQIPAMTPTDMETHGGEDVPVYARGPMAHLLTGVHEQNFIAHVMAYASCVGENQRLCDKNISGGEQGRHGGGGQDNSDSTDTGYSLLPHTRLVLALSMLLSLLFCINKLT